MMLKLLRLGLFVVGVVILGMAVVSWESDSERGTLEPPQTAQASGLDKELGVLWDDIQAGDATADTYGLMGLTYLRKHRETGDGAHYISAEIAFNTALELDSDNFSALVGNGILAAGRHDFEDAVVWAEKAQAINPYRAEPLGVLVDAHVELGNYQTAIRLADEMVSLKPSTESYARISYLRELHGDVDGAIMAMQSAVSASEIGSEPWLWSQTELAKLHLNHGDTPTAQSLLSDALDHKSDYVYAINGMAKIHAQNGDAKTAINLLRPVVSRLPIPEFVEALGGYYTQDGNNRAAQRQYAFVQRMYDAQTKNGMDVDLELLLFQATHSDDSTNLIDQAEAIYALRPSIQSAETAAWVYYQAGDYTTAETYINDAMRLGTQSSTLYHRAALIADALGQSDQASSYFETARSINPNYTFFSGQG